ncbi:MAG: hypothetical protein M0033_13950 [Nitrospiraceae bacterium]|nr:hypothetical protein [Nitrospiraceae bacterium]
MAIKTMAGILLPAFLTIIAGCGGLLPSTRETVKSPWTNFDEAKKSYDSIQLDETTARDLKRLGFDPYTNPNIMIITYVDIIQKFMFNPSIKMQDLDEGLQKCIRAKTACRAYSVTPGIIYDKRTGNFFMDFFNFKRHVKKTGWRFDALVVMVDNVVVYKQWGGSPAIDSITDTKNPLGPFQGASDVLINVIKP